MHLQLVGTTSVERNVSSTVKRSFAEVATFRQRLFIWLLGPDCGSSGLRRPLPRLAGGAIIPGDRPKARFRETAGAVCAGEFVTVGGGQALPSSLSNSGFRAGSGRQSSRRRAVDLTANRRLLGARVPVSVAVAFVLGEEALAPPHWAEQRVNIRFRFQAMVTRLHSPRTLSSPRSRN